MRARAIALGAMLLGPGCKIDGSIGRDVASGTRGGGGSGEEMETEADTDPSGDGSAGSASTSVGGGEGSGMGGDTATGPSDHPPLCHPTPDDEPCARCRKISCCAALEACVLHDSCLCWWDCRATDQGAAQCAESCGSDGLLYEELQTCAQAHCDSCPPAM